MHTDHRMVLADLKEAAPQRNGAYRMQRQGCPIKQRTVRPFMEGEAEFATLKGEVDRTKRITKVQES